MVKSKDIDEKIDGENKGMIVPIKTVFWETDIEDQKFLDLFDFNGVAFRGCSKYIGDVASDKYTVENDAYEKVRKDLDIDDIINYATERAYVSGVSFIYLGIPDGKDVDEELTVKMVPDFLDVISKSWFILDQYNNPELIEDKYQIQDEDGNTFFVHKSRLIEVIIRKDKKSSYLPAYRALISQDSNLWSISQALFRGGAGLLHAKITDPINFSDSGTTINEVDKVKSDGTFNKINAETAFISDDRYDLDLKGVNGQRVPIKDSWETVLVECSIALRIPFQLLIGANAGAVQGSETNIKEYLAEVNSFRVRYLDKLVNVLGESFGFERLDIEFETLFEETDIEKSEIFKTFTEGLKNLIEQGVISKESANKYLNEKFDLNLQVGEVEDTTPQQTDQTKTTIQTLILSKSRFDTEQEARKWIGENNFKSTKIDITENSYRFRQKDPSGFVENSFRTIGLTNGVSAVIGKLKGTDQGMRFDYIVIIKPDLTREEAVTKLISLGRNYIPDHYEFNELGHNFKQFMNVVPGSAGSLTQTSDPLVTLITAEISEFRPHEEIITLEEEVNKNPDDFISSEEFLEIHDPLVSSETPIVTSMDIKTPFYPKLVPPMISPWDKKKFVNLIDKAAGVTQKVLDGKFKFTNIQKAMKGSVFFDSTFVKKISYAIDRWFKGTDTEQDAMIVIDEEVDSFKNVSKLALTPVVIQGINSALLEANLLIGSTIVLTDRAKALHDTIKNGAIDKLTGISEDMRKDLRRELETAMINGDSPAQAAKRFRKFVSVDFANRYNRRLETLARTEMVNVFNSTAQQSYKDSGIVIFNQWITSQDTRVRPKHRPMHGQVVKVGQSFSNGMVYPNDINERCGVVPYFP